MGQSWHILNNESNGMFFQHQKCAWSLRKGRLAVMTQEPGHLSQWGRWSLQTCHRHFRSPRLSPGSSIPSVQHQHLWPHRTKQLHALQWNSWGASVPFTAMADGLQVLLAPLSALQKHQPDGTWSFTHPCFQPARLFNRNVTSAKQKLSNYVKSHLWIDKRFH